MWMVKVVSFMYFCVHHCIQNDPSVKYFHIEYDGMDWITANESCGNLNGTLIRITDIEANFNITREEFLKTISPFWSSINGLFSPWIAYRGCYPRQAVDTYISKWNLNSVGNCFFQCKNQSSDPYGCTYFALGGDTCYCMCSIPRDKLAYSNNCNITCNNSTDDGFCGGNGYVTLYEVNSYNGTGDGFCMAYSCGSTVLQSFGHDCDERHEGYCVDRSSNVHKQGTATWNNYSVACKNRNLFLAASTARRSNCLGYVWNGIRRYEFHHGERVLKDKDCYKIKRDLGTWMYEKTDCSVKLPFVCKIKDRYQSSGRTSGANIFENTTNVNTSTELSTSPQTGGLVSSFHPFTPGTTITTTITKETTKLSVNITDLSTFVSPETFQITKNNTIGLVTGSVSGSILLLIAIAVVIYFVRRKQSMNKRAKIVQNAIYGLSDSERVTGREKDVIYMNTIGKNSDNSDAEYSPNTNEVYVEKDEGEYDRLRSSRNRLGVMDEESYYDRSENNYSTTARKGHIYGSHYDCMSSSEEKQYDSKDIEHYKVYGSDYSSLEENTYGSSSGKHNFQETSHYDTTIQE